MNTSCRSCDSEQVDDWNNNDDILSEMVYTCTTFHWDVIVSSYRVDHSIELSASVTKKVITSISPDMINIEIK